MKSREQKQKELEALRAELEKSPSLFVTGYEKMTVQQDYELRKVSAFSRISRWPRFCLCEGKFRSQKIHDPENRTDF